MKATLEIKNLSKYYGKVTAVNDLSISVPEKSVFGLLGPNGSGKTTTLGMILDVIEKSNGSFKWDIGKEGNERKSIGAILESPNFYPYLSAVKNLQLICEIKGVDESAIEKRLKQVDLFNRKDDAFKTYSLGMKQRLAIASALLADPEVLILDEPTNGLDPKGIVEIRQIIRDIAKEGRTIILASHLLDEVQKVCSHFCVLNKGSLIYQGEVSKLSKDKNQYAIRSKNKLALIDHLNASPLISKFIEEEGLIIVTLKDDVSIEQVMQALANAQLFIDHLTQQKFNLEKKFIEILDEKA